MPLGTSYIPDTTAFHAAGVTQALTVAQMNALYGAANVKTATTSFSFNWNGVSVNFVKGLPVYCDAGLLAKLSALGAPVA